MIILFTDFGVDGPYVGQIKTVLAARLGGMPTIPVIDLMHDAPRFRPRPSGYLLAALTGRLAPELPRGAVVLGVIDPGVGTKRAPLVVRAGGFWFVGPDNGLFDPVLRRDPAAAAWRVTWRPPRLSASFHGRDLFAPVAALVARGGAVPGEPIPVDTVRRPDWPDDLAEVIYIDDYGNAMTGLRAAALPEDAQLTVNGRHLARAGTFGAVPEGAAFWYENSSGLAEIAINQSSAAAEMGLAIGTRVSLGQGETGPR